MSVFYNDNDPFCIDWLGRLGVAGHLPAGAIDARPIEAIEAWQLEAFAHCHFFAGIGGWALALDLAGWPADREVWTGSCPCQPFSQAGKGLAEKDTRHVWPAWRRLIAQRRPPTIFGEQVASPAGRGWLAGIRLDLEKLGYAVGAADLCVAGVGAPHIRQRLYWVADADGRVKENEHLQRGRQHRQQPKDSSPGDRLANAGGSERRWRADQERPAGILLHTPDRSSVDRLGQPAMHDARAGLHPQTARGRRPLAGGSGQARRMGVTTPPGNGPHKKPGGSAPSENEGRLRIPRGSGPPDAAVDRLGEPILPRLERHTRHENGPAGPAVQNRYAPPPGAWSGYDLIPCRDGKIRRIESGTFPLAHGVPCRVGRLRGYGNAIVPQAAAEFVIAFLESES